MATSASKQCLVNGVPKDSVSVLDRGLLYGDGVFETIRFVRGRSPLWARHIDRLKRSLRVLGIPAPDPAQLLSECKQLIAKQPDAVIRITLTRGQGGQAYFPPGQAEPNRILTLRSPAQPKPEINMIRSTVTLNSTSVLAGIKHLNRLEQVLIARECQLHGAQEALVSDQEGWLVEGLSGNIVLHHGGQLIAPGPHPAAVWGVGLDWLRALLKCQLSERPFHRDELQPDDSIWVINSVQGVRLVHQLDGHLLPPSTALDPAITAWNTLFE